MVLFVGWVKENRMVFGAVTGGILLMLVGGGLWIVDREPVEVEIIAGDKDSEPKDQQEIWVDVGGAVVRPGVYQLSAGARVKDALTEAGGLSEEADRSKLARYVNLAARLEDGTKLYFASKDEEIVSLESGIVNINTAGVSELDKLWGVGPGRAGEIVAGRPYGSVEELMTRKIIPSNVYGRIKDQIGVN